MTTTTPNQFSPSPNNRRHLLVAVILLLLAVAGLSVDWSGKSASTPPHQSAVTDTSPDSIVDNPQLETFGDGGRLIRQLSGTKITMFDKEHRNLVESPRLVVEQRSGSKAQPIPWEITADHAIAFSATSIIELHGNATLYSSATAGGPTKITSEYLRVDVDRKFAETDKTVTIKTHGSESHATGMKADIDRQHIFLPSRVKEIHEVRR